MHFHISQHSHQHQRVKVLLYIWDVYYCGNTPDGLALLYQSGLELNNIKPLPRRCISTFPTIHNNIDV